MYEDARHKRKEIDNNNNSSTCNVRGLYSKLVRSGQECYGYHLFTTTGIVCIPNRVHFSTSIVRLRVE
jgi:hypothetical protein